MTFPLYVGFDDRDDVADQFSEKLDPGVEILVAVYDTPPYEGYAWVVFIQDGVMYEVHSSHCSCFGLEDTWAPETVTLTELEDRAARGWHVGEDDATHLVKDLIQYLKEQA